MASRKGAKVAKERQGRIRSVLGVVGSGLRRVPEAVGHAGAKVSPLCDLRKKDMESNGVISLLFIYLLGIEDAFAQRTALKRKCCPVLSRLPLFHPEKHCVVRCRWNRNLLGWLAQRALPHRLPRRGRIEARAKLDHVVPTRLPMQRQPQAPAAIEARLKAATGNDIPARTEDHHPIAGRRLNLLE